MVVIATESLGTVQSTNQNHKKTQEYSEDCWRQLRKNVDSVEENMTGIKELLKKLKQAIQLQRESNQNSIAPKWKCGKGENLTGIERLFRTQRKGRIGVKTQEEVVDPEDKTINKKLGEAPREICELAQLTVIKNFCGKD